MENNIHRTSSDCNHDVKNNDMKIARSPRNIKKKKKIKNDKCKLKMKISTNIKMQWK